MKEYWFITTDGRVLECNEDACWSGEKEIGNYFETKEEAEQAVEKIRAFKRLKDKGFRFDGYNSITCSIDYDVDSNEDIREELFTLFGGEE